MQRLLAINHINENIQEKSALMGWTSSIEWKRAAEWGRERESDRDLLKLYMAILYSFRHHLCNKNNSVPYMLCDLKADIFVVQLCNTFNISCFRTMLVRSLYAIFHGYVLSHEYSVRSVFPSLSLIVCLLFSSFKNRFIGTHFIAEHSERVFGARPCMMTMSLINISKHLKLIKV